MDGCLTFPALAEAAEAEAAPAGVGRGVLVAIVAANGIAWMVALLAILWLHARVRAMEEKVWLVHMGPARVLQQV
jgi:acyl-CoA synthetase (AMP-forming)/AMP-acid ligase II